MLWCAREDNMIDRAELARELHGLEAEYRYWLVEAICIERGIENIEEKIDRHEVELGPERVADFRLRLARTRECHRLIEEKIRYVRLRLDDLRAWLDELP
jgi:hypothetical protein